PLLRGGKSSRAPNLVARHAPRAQDSFQGIGQREMILATGSARISTVNSCGHGPLQVGNQLTKPLARLASPMPAHTELCHDARPLPITTGNVSSKMRDLITDPLALCR